MSPAKTVSIACATPRFRSDGRQIMERKRVPVIDRAGCWAVTPCDALPWRFAVTHVPSGFCAYRVESLPKAKQAMRAFASLPDQSKWRRATYGRRLPKALSVRGEALVTRLMALDKQRKREDGR